MQAHLVLNAILYPCVVVHVMRKFWWHTSSVRKRHQPLPFPFLPPCDSVGPPVSPVLHPPSGMCETGELDTASHCAGQGEGATGREQKEKLNPPGARVNLCLEYGPVQSSSGAILGMQIDHVSCFLITSCEHALACETTPFLSRIDSCEYLPWSKSIPMGVYPEQLTAPCLFPSQLSLW